MAPFPLRPANQNSILSQFREPANFAPAPAAAPKTLPKDSYGSDVIPGLLPNSLFSTDIMLRWSSALSSNIQLQEKVFERYPDLCFAELDAVRLPNLPVSLGSGIAGMGMVFGSYYNTLYLGDGVDIPGNTFIIHVPAHESDHAKAPFIATPLYSAVMTSPEVPSTLELIRQVNIAERKAAAKKQEEATSKFFRTTLNQASTPVDPDVQPVDPRPPLPTPASDAPKAPPKVLTIATHATALPSISLAPDLEGPHDVYLADEIMMDSDSVERALERDPTSPLSSAPSTPIPPLEPLEPLSHLPSLPYIPPPAFATQANATAPRLVNRYNLRSSTRRPCLKETPSRPKRSQPRKVSSGITKARARRSTTRPPSPPHASTSHAIAEDDRERLDQVLDLPVTNWTNSEATMVKGVSNALARASVERVGFGEYFI